MSATYLGENLILVISPVWVSILFANSVMIIRNYFILSISALYRQTAYTPGPSLFNRKHNV